MKTFWICLTILLLGILTLLGFVKYIDNLTPLPRTQSVTIDIKPVEPTQENNELTDDEVFEWWLKRIIENADSANMTLSLNNHGYCYGIVSIYFDSRPELELTEIPYESYEWEWEND